MKALNNIFRSSNQELWSLIEKDLSRNASDYNVTVIEDHKGIDINIDIDPESGPKSRFASTKFYAFIKVLPGFKFGVHHRGFSDRIGKFLGMQNIALNYPDFGDTLIVKSNDELTALQVFEDAEIRNTLAGLKNFDLVIHPCDNDEGDHQKCIELTIGEGIAEARPLKQIYSAFLKVLRAVENLQPRSLA